MRGAAGNGGPYRDHICALHFAQASDQVSFHFPARKCHKEDLDAIALVSDLIFRDSLYPLEKVVPRDKPVLN